MLGLMTPIVAIVIALGSLVIVFTDPDLIQVIVLATAVAFFGPGAFSIDARLFGRREILIPKNSPEPR